MATTTLVTSTLLATGEETTAVTVSFANGRVALDFAATEVTATSQVRLVLKDTLGRGVYTDIIEGTDTQRVVLDDAELDVAGSMSATIECLRGSARVVLTSETGTGAVTPGTVVAADLPDGLLSADADGREVMADDFFTTAEFVAGAGGKFAPDCLDAVAVANVLATDALTTAILNDAFVDDSIDAAFLGDKIAANAFDGAACANAFLNGAIPVAKVAAAPFSLETAIADPGAAANIVVTSSGTCSLTIAAPADNRGLPIPAAEGLVMVITHFAGANAGTVTSAQALDIQGTTVLNFVAELGQWIMLVAVSNGTALRWRIVAQGGLAVTTETPVYVPLVFANVLTGAAIPVTASGRIALTTAGGGENRTLAIPTFEGQRLTIESIAANAAHTVTCAAAFDPLGAVVLYFKGGVNEQITLEARMVVAGLVWRVAVDEDLVSHYIPDAGTGNAIPVTRMHTIMPITTAGGGPETNTLAIPARLGQTMCLVDDVQGVNDRTITVTGDMDSAGNDLITPTAAGQAISLKAVQVAGALVWRLVGNDGCTLA